MRSSRGVRTPGSSGVTIAGRTHSFADAIAEAAKTDAVVMTAGTISEEGADRAKFTAIDGQKLATLAAIGGGAGLICRSFKHHFEQW